MSRAGTIDGLKFARERGALSGQLALAALPRLAASGCSGGLVEYRIEGAENAAGRPCLRIAARGSLEFECQRCMRPLAMPVEVAAELELAESREAAEAAEDEVDRVVASRSMDVAALVEDELLLALPMVPMHEQCGFPAKDDGAKASPFAALEKLRRGVGG